MQALFLLAHSFIFHTWIVFWPKTGANATVALRVAFFLLAFSFIVAALLGFYFANGLVTLIYRIAAVWLGFLNFLFMAACATWIVWFGLLLFRLHPNPDTIRPQIAGACFGIAILVCVYGLLNAYWIRVRRISVKLPNLPVSWRGRTALLLSDLHLGNVNGTRFCRRIAAMAVRLRPDIIFVPGDLFDGSKVDPDRLSAPLQELSALFGIYFSSGNHDEFGGSSHYTAAILRAGFHILANEKATVDGLQILALPYSISTSPLHFRAALEALKLDPNLPSILLNHVPNRLPIVEQSGISLQLSGHTHGGQIFPFTWFTRRIYGKFTDGLQQFGALQVYTSSGAGTWGPPMRVGTHPEIVLITFE
jgi:hypothetical protein